MPQQQGHSDVRILLIGGVQVPGFIKINEQGYDEDSIEVPEYGFTGLIGSGQEKAIAMELEFITKRDGVTTKYFNDWKSQGKDARDVVEYLTDKSGSLENAFSRRLYQNCELGPIKRQDFDQGSRKLCTLKVTLFPGKPPEERLLV